MYNIYSFDVTMNNFLRMKIDKTQRDMMELCLLIRYDWKKDYIERIVLFAVGYSQGDFKHSLEHSHWHDNERSIIELIRTKEFWILRCT
jgi:hypothetical protein